MYLYGLKEDADLAFYFTDLMGRTVDLHPSFQSDRVMLTPDAPGIYLVTVVSGNAVETKRFVRVD